MGEKNNTRIKREEKTIGAMVLLYCKNHHKSPNEGLCDTCKTVQNYAVKRLHNCPFIEKKPTCGNCLIHCYNKDMQNKVREIMRYAGPRLLFSHPFLALCHLLDGRITPQPLNTSGARTPQSLKDKTDGNIP